MVLSIAEALPLLYASLAEALPLLYASLADALLPSYSSGSFATVVLLAEALPPPSPWRNLFRHRLMDGSFVVVVSPSVGGCFATNVVSWSFSRRQS
jgi:hypothetical protein